ncbi:MAG: tryptophan--tRNA ligase [Spirochaetaceae bacterium]|jgi:tryptophanyl-tRNA synthetase|nr:tryptophan--tRNA ligase [Spirochaetaceae bacterium]
MDIQLYDKYGFNPNCPSPAEAHPSDTYGKSLELSARLEADILTNPQNHVLLTGDRPTGRLHIGHYFGSLLNRVRLSGLGVKTYIVIADYQVLTDHEVFSEIAQNTKQLVIDYLAAGLVPGENCVIFPHSYVPELNQLMLPFLTLVSNAELERNPTVKEEIGAAALKSVNAGMYTYPVHQACDILFCKGTVVPVGKDQLPHLEMTRLIARRFNEKYALKKPILPAPFALLSKSPNILGLDGSQKMSKSRNNAVFLSATEDETAALIKKAQTDGNRTITYDPVNRPEVANLLVLVSLSTGDAPEAVAARIGDGGAGALKKALTEALNEKLRPLRAERARLEKDPAHIRRVLLDGVERACKTAHQTLTEVRRAMNMEI